MEEYGESNAGTNQIWKLAYNSELQVRREEGNGQVQQWCNYEEIPLQQNPYSPYQPNFHSQTQPHFYPSLQDSFQNPYNNYFPYSPEIDQNFFYHPDSFQNSQAPFYDNDFPHLQNQQQLFYPQPQAQDQSYSNVEFQQGGHQCYEPQPPLFSEEEVATLLEALKPDPEWFIKREKEEKEFISVIQRAGFPWRSSDSEMKNTKQEEEEKAPILVDKALEWHLEVEEREFDAEEEKFREENEFKGEEEEKMVEEIDYHSYPMFRVGDRVIAYDQYEEEEREKMVAADDYHCYPKFRIGDKVIAYDQYVEEKRIAAAMQYLAELDIPFPAALNRTLQQKEEEAKKKKLEEEKMLSLLLTRKEEGEREKTLEEDEYFSLLFREEEAASANIACGFHQKRKQKKKGKKKKKMDAMLRIKEEGEKEENLQISPYSPHLHKLKDKDAEESTGSNSNFLLHEAHYITTGQHQTNEEKLEEEEEEELELLLFQATQQQLEEGVGKEKTLAIYGPPFLVKEEEAEQSRAKLLNPALDIHNEQQQVEKEREVKKLAVQWEWLEEEEEAEELELLLHATQYKQEQQLEGEEEKKKLEACKDFTLLEGDKEATMEELTCADLDSLLQEADQLMQYGTFIKEKGEKEENLQISLYSLQLLRIKDKAVEDFTSAEFDFLLLEENPIKDGQHQGKEKKPEEEKKSSAPSLQEHEVSELHHPQATTPRQKEAAAYPSNANSFSFEFELTLNQFLLSLNVFISGDKLKVQQLSLQVICKLHLIEVSGDVHKKGARGDGVPWFIKVHPP